MVQRCRRIVPLIRNQGSVRSSSLPGVLAVVSGQQMRVKHYTSLTRHLIVSVTTKLFCFHQFANVERLSSIVSGAFVTKGTASAAHQIVLQILPMASPTRSLGCKEYDDYQSPEYRLRGQVHETDIKGESRLTRNRRITRLVISTVNMDDSSERSWDIGSSLTLRVKAQQMK